MTESVHKNFSISFEIRSDGAYDVDIDFENMDPTLQKSSICILPPDITDLMPPPGTPDTRSWRRNPHDVPLTDLPFMVASLDKLRDFGERLFTTILPPQMENTLVNCLGEANSLGKSLRIHIDLTRAPGLAVVPWEALFRRVSDDFLGIDDRTPIVRRLPANTSRPPLKPLDGTIRLLIIIAVPRKDLDAGMEIANLQATVRNAAARSDVRIEVEVLTGATRGALEAMLERFRPDIIHFIGHGGFAPSPTPGHPGSGHIFLIREDDANAYDRVDSDDFRDIVAAVRPLLVVLNTCEGGTADAVDRYGGTAQNLIRRAIPYVVAMQFPISDTAALAFSRYFYERLFEGGSVDAAVTRGRAAIRNRPDEETQVELITPVLYTSVAEPGPLVLASKRRRRRRIAPAVLLAVAIVLAALAGAAWWERSGTEPDAENMMATDVFETSANTGAQTTAPTARITFAPPSRRSARRSSAPTVPHRSPTAVAPGIPHRNLAQAIPERAPAAVDAGEPFAHHLGYAATAGENATAPLMAEPLSETPIDAQPTPGSPTGSPSPSGDVTTTSYLAFFDFNSIALGPEAAAVVERARDHLGALGAGGRIALAGHADSVGGLAVNMRVSRMRADAVAALLVREGVPRTRIVTEAFGETRPRVATADGVRDVQNRRVEIHFVAAGNDARRP